MKSRNAQTGQPASTGPAPIGSPMRLWQLQQAPPICPTCQTYCRCRRTILKEEARVQYRYCDCGYKTKTILPVK
ncbi:MAG TPA: hypothetical protein VEI07_07100 [Planctomycetaceae bacterium]|nr:hypothetical protein [Planctomycetaceae bacterium]